MNHTCLCIPSQSWFSFTNTGGMEGWVGLGGWLHTEINVRHQEMNPDTVVHLSTNRALHRLTSLIEANAITTTPDHQPLLKTVLTVHHIQQSWQHVPHLRTSDGERSVTQTSCVFQLNCRLYMSQSVTTTQKLPQNLWGPPDHVYMAHNLPGSSTTISKQPVWEQKISEDVLTNLAWCQWCSHRKRQCQDRADHRRLHSVTQTSSSLSVLIMHANHLPGTMKFPKFSRLFSSDRQHLSDDVCLEVRGKIIRTVLCCIVYWSCAQSEAHLGPVAHT